MLKLSSMKRLLPQILTPTLVLITLLAVCMPIYKNGYIYHTDVTESISIDNLYQRYIYTYSNDIGEALAEKARIPIFYTVYGTYKLLSSFGIEDSAYVKLKVVFLLLASAAAFYFTTKSTLKRIHDEETVPLPVILIASFAGTFFYTLNYWFSNRIVHFGLFYTTVTVPVTFYILHNFLFSKGIRKKPLIVLALFLGAFSATPHTLLFIFLIFFVLLTVFWALPHAELGEKVKKTALVTLFTVVYILVNAYWILPYVTTQPTPDAVLSETIVNILGRYNTLQNSIKLTGYWLTNQQAYYPNNLGALHSLVSYIPFVITIITLYLYRKKPQIWLPLAILAALGIFLSTSSKLTNTFYFWLMFNSPIKSFGWLFREYDKFGLILTFTYSVSVSLFITQIFRNKKVLMLSTMAISLVFVSYTYFSAFTFKQRYTPVQVPQSYQTAVSFLSKDKEEFNTVWYPEVTQPYWADNEEVRFVFSNLVTPKPSIVNQSVVINYLNFLFKEENVYAINVGKALDLLGVKYLIIRNDEQEQGKHYLVERMDIQKSLEKTLETPEFTIYRNLEFSGLTKATTVNLVTGEGLKTLRYMDQLNLQTKTGSITYIDKDPLPQGIPTEYFIQEDKSTEISFSQFHNKFIFPANYTNKKDDGKPGFWNFGSLENKNHAETDYFLKNLGIPQYQFDNKSMVVIARDGWMKTKSTAKPTNTYQLTFSQHQNVSVKKDKLKYSSLPGDFKYYWNIIRSDKISANALTALEVQFKSQIPTEVIPHFKITFYDESQKTLETKTLYAEENGHVEYLLKVPANTKFFDFSIWTLSGSAEPYSYTVDKPTILNISNSVKPIELAFTANTSCVGTCSLYARVLKNHQAGSIGVTVGNTTLASNTQVLDDQIQEEYLQWVKLGTLQLPNDNPTRITLSNPEGLNIVNALVFLSPGEETALQKYHQPVVRIPDQNSIHIITTQVNPTKYKVEVLDGTNSPVLLTFAKNFSPNWVLSGTEYDTIEVNGYINGWMLDNLKPGIYYIDYAPQKYFKTGALISAITGVILIGLLGTRFLNRYPKDSTY
jgi:hypothetical protein